MITEENMTLWGGYGDTRGIGEGTEEYIWSEDIGIMYEILN